MSENVEDKEIKLKKKYKELKKALTTKIRRLEKNIKIQEETNKILKNMNEKLKGENTALKDEKLKICFNIDKLKLLLKANSNELTELRKKNESLSNNDDRYQSIKKEIKEFRSLQLKKDNLSKLLKEKSEKERTIESKEKIIKELNEEKKKLKKKIEKINSKKNELEKKVEKLKSAANELSIVKEKNSSLMVSKILFEKEKFLLQKQNLEMKNDLNEKKQEVDVNKGVIDNLRRINTTLNMEKKTFQIEMSNIIKEKNIIEKKYKEIHIKCYSDSNLSYDSDDSDDDIITVINEDEKIYPNNNKKKVEKEKKSQYFKRFYHFLPCFKKYAFFSIEKIHVIRKRSLFWDLLKLPLLLITLPFVLFPPIGIFLTYYCMIYGKYDGILFCGKGRNVTRYMTLEKVKYAALLSYFLYVPGVIYALVHWFIMLIIHTPLVVLFGRGKKKIHKRIISKKKVKKKE